ncbi:MAG: N-acetyl-gamma-glutamyl-phosphate reductase [Zetaproteobacteria bacterium]|nr:MAG: N-acetyl-gamma-glutamyl-phosphate reductase [Zetaproteobacteria bacterium]
MQQIDVAILGASGYTGAELIRILDAHPHFRIVMLAAHSQAGQLAGDVLPGLASPWRDIKLGHIDDPLPDRCQLVFTALPHAAAANSVQRALAAGKRVIDLSADFRHRSAETYQTAYGCEHPHPKLLTEAVYGLSEFARARIAATRLLANPGCYPTCTLLPLVPLLRAGVLDDAPIIVDAKSGASGAGRGAKTDLLYCELNESVRAYGLPRHRHSWEMEEWAAFHAGRSVRVRFVPHILPMNRGMLCTLHLSGRDTAKWHEILHSAFIDEPFVQVLPAGRLPSTTAVKGSNRCDIGISELGAHEAVVVSCIDNLLKGAAGQAVQNANIMFGLEETLGLARLPCWP